MTKTMKIYKGDDIYLNTDEISCTSLEELFDNFINSNMWSMEILVYRDKNQPYVDVYKWWRNFTQQNLDQYVDIVLTLSVFKKFTKIEENEKGCKYEYSVKYYDKIYKRNINRRMTLEILYEAKR